MCARACVPVCGLTMYALMLVRIKSINSLVISCILMSKLLRHTLELSVLIPGVCVEMHGKFYHLEKNQTC